MDAANRIDRLFRLPPDEFVAARDELVRELRTGGDKEAAAEVKALRRPTVAAWALNQAARQRRELVESLADLGQELRDAQEIALSAGDASGLRAATAKRRELVGDMTGAALGVLTRTGRDSRAQAPAIGAILDAVVTNPAVADLLLQARLVSEPEPVEIDLAGFGGNGDFVPAPPKPSRQRTQTGRGLRLTGPEPPEAAADPEEPEEPDVRVSLRKALGAAQWDHDRAVRAATDAAAALEAATARAATAAVDREQAERRLEAATKTLADTESRLTAAGHAHEAAQAEVHRTAEELERARRSLEERAGG